MSSLSPSCGNNGCYCDNVCHIYGDCCSDIADIGCQHASSSSPTPTPTDSLGKSKIRSSNTVDHILDLINLYLIFLE